VTVIFEEKLLSKLENKAYREAYVSEHVKTSIPIQIRHLREQRELTQTELAVQAKTTQTVISRLEDPNYGNLTLNSLIKIAAALDIGLLVKFVPFSRLLSEFQDLSPKALLVASFKTELPMLKELATMAMPNINNETIGTTMPHTAVSTDLIAEVEQWGEIQAQLLKPQLVTTKNAAIKLTSTYRSIQLAFSNAGGVSMVMATPAIGGHPVWGSIGRGITSPMSNFQGEPAIRNDDRRHSLALES
jgi:transcriptional regulator with XRE-family HTH domain